VVVVSRDDDDDRFSDNLTSLLKENKTNQDSAVGSVA